MTYDPATDLPDLLRQVSILIRSSQPLTDKQKDVAGEVLGVAADLIEEQANRNAMLATSMEQLVGTLSEMVGRKGGA